MPSPEPTSEAMRSRSRIMHLQLSASSDCCRILQEGIYDAFEKAVTKKASEFKQGGGLDPSTTLGPLIGHSAVDRVGSPEPHPES